MCVLESVRVEWVKTLVNNGVSQDKVDSVFSEMMSSFSAMFSGDTLYIKTERIEKIRLRNISISSEFANGNYKELARKYNLSVRQIRNIVDRHNF